MTALWGVKIPCREAIFRVENVVVKNTKVSTTNPESSFMHRDNSSFGVRNRTILYIYARKCTEVSQMVIGRSEHFVQPLRSVS